jgi:hypothetical protein
MFISTNILSVSVHFNSANVSLFWIYSIGFGQTAFAELVIVGNTASICPFRQYAFQNTRLQDFGNVRTEKVLRP